MNIAKILKFYLGFTLLLAGISVLSYSSTVKNSMVSVLHTIDQYDQISIRVNDENKKFNLALGNFARFNKEEKKFVKNDQDGLMTFQIINEPEKAFGQPGAQKVKVMGLDLKTKEQAVEINALRFKINGVAADKIKKAYLSLNGEPPSEGNIDGEYIKFSLGSYELTSYSQVKMDVLVDLSADLKTGQRIRLDIEDPKDIELKINNKDYLISSFYPLQGPYLTIAKGRSWKIFQLPEGALINPKD